MRNDINSKKYVERIQRVEDVITSVAAGDYTKRINTEFNDDFSGVEAGVDLIINDLIQELKKAEQNSKELENKLKTIELQKQTILQQQHDLLELSSPVIKVWENVLVLPVIGTVDSRRAQTMMENLLQSIVNTGCTLAILDITGVLRIDTQVANHLIKTVEAVRLLGAECIVSGLSPAIAQTIVQLGIDLSAIKTKANLLEAMRSIFQKGEK